MNVLLYSGWINGIKTMTRNDGVGVLMLLIATIFSILAGFCSFLLFKVNFNHGFSLLFFTVVVVIVRTELFSIYVCLYIHVYSINMYAKVELW